jgi:hypothetical protein
MNFYSMGGHEFLAHTKVSRCTNVEAGKGAVDLHRKPDLFLMPYLLLVCHKHFADVSCPSSFPTYFIMAVIDLSWTFLFYEGPCSTTVNTIYKHLHPLVGPSDFIWRSDL